MCTYICIGLRKKSGIDASVVPLFRSGGGQALGQDLGQLKWPEIKRIFFTCNKNRSILKAIGVRLLSIVLPLFWVSICAVCTQNRPTAS